MSPPQVAVLGLGRFNPRAARVPAGAGRMEVLTLTSFALLGGYGVIRWATMLVDPHLWRLVGLLGLAVALAGLGRLAHEAPRALRPALVVACALAALAMIPMSGFPLAWAWHVRLAVQARAIGDGLSALPGVIVPYRGHDRATAGVIVLGAGMLLLGGALTLATTHRRPPTGGHGPSRELRLVGAALPLVVLAIVPSALARPSVAYLHGVVLFALLALFVFSDRVGRGRALGAVAAVTLAAVGALVLSPTIEAGSPFIRFTTLAGTLGAGGRGGERFDWSQTYGPLSWPHTGGSVLDIQARFPYYWKAENLNFFNGTDWVAASVGDASDPLAGVSPVALTRYTQVLSVTDRGIRTANVIAAGAANPPAAVAGQPVAGGSAPGTFVTAGLLEPGDTYQVRVYTPRPSGGQLAVVGDRYPVAVASPELTLELSPGGGTTGLPATIPAESFEFAPYGSASAFARFGGMSSAQATRTIEASAWGPVFALAQRLKAATSTPYGYVSAVLRYLARGFAYNQDTPLTANPLLTFLLRTKAGYCQQFAGAMALLLRMGGIPARVAAGFATGTYDLSASRYVVSDIDAHAWVEAWFPTYGWVKFDPTPTAAPALGGRIGISPGQNRLGHPHQSRATGRHQPDTGAAATARRRHRDGGSGVLGLALWVALALAGLAGGAWLVAVRRRPRASPEALAAELERAFARCRRPLPGGTTLAAVERTLADSPGAAAYVRALRQTRYAGRPSPPTAEQRRAVRARLARGLGLRGRLRALIALPPWSGPGRPGRSYTERDG